MTEEQLLNMAKRLKSLEEQQIKDFQQLSNEIIDMNCRVNSMTTQVNTLLDQAEELFGLKQGGASSGMLDAKTVSLRTLVDAVNSLRQEITHIKNMLRDQ